MSQSVEIQPELDVLLAKQEIRDVVMRFCRAADRLDLDLARSCYHPDAWDDHGSYRGGPEGLIEALAVDMGDRTLGTYHLLGQSLIEVDGDRAESETYIVAYHRLPAGAKHQERDLVVGARYLDVFERRGDRRWLIAWRGVSVSWSRVDPVGAPWPGEANYFPSTRGDGADLVFNLSDPPRRAQGD